MIFETGKYYCINNDVIEFLDYDFKNNKAIFITINNEKLEYELHKINEDNNCVIVNNEVYLPNEIKQYKKGLNYYLLKHKCKCIDDEHECLIFKPVDSNDEPIIGTVGLDGYCYEVSFMLKPLKWK